MALVPIPGVGPIRSHGEQRQSFGGRPMGRAPLCDSQNHPSRRGRDRAYQVRPFNSSLQSAFTMLSRKRRGEERGSNVTGKEGRKKRRQAANIVFPKYICSSMYMLGKCQCLFYKLMIGVSKRIKYLHSTVLTYFPVEHLHR